MKIIIDNNLLKLSQILEEFQNPKIDSIFRSNGFAFKYFALKFSKQLVKNALTDKKYF